MNADQPYSKNPFDTADPAAVHEQMLDRANELAQAGEFERLLDIAAFLLSTFALQAHMTGEEGYNLLTSQLVGALTKGASKLEEHTGKPLGLLMVHLMTRAAALCAAITSPEDAPEVFHTPSAFLESVAEEFSGIADDFEDIRARYSVARIAAQFGLDIGDLSMIPELERMDAEDEREPFNDGTEDEQPF